MISENSKIKLGYGQGCLDLTIGEAAEVVLSEELSAAPHGEIDRSIDHVHGKTLDDLLAANLPQSSPATSPDRFPTTSYFPRSSAGSRGLGILDLKIVFALGTHRRMTAPEERLLLRDCTNLPYIQHDPRKCVYLGETRLGTPVEVLKSVASSDLIVATGNIEYHYYAGYSGGTKAVLPGVKLGTFCGQES